MMIAAQPAECHAGGAVAFGAGKRGLDLPLLKRLISCRKQHGRPRPAAKPAWRLFRPAVRLP